MNFKNKDILSKAGIVLFLIIAIAGIYWQVGGFSFVLYDDEEYIILNPRLRIGFTFENIRWYLTSSFAGNWHPVTWFSHILDVQLFGLHAMGHHLTSVVLHGINSILLFLFLQRFTGSLWRSASVAALFAVHPLNVESVAWIAERKNVLSTLFWILTLYFYASYTEQKSKSFYMLSVFTFILGLMSKQMLVSIPFVLLLLDYWPLRRISRHTEIKMLVYTRSKEFGILILEKLPFLILSIIASVIVVVSQNHAINSLSGYSLGRRFANAATSYIQYLRKFIWPDDLIVFYPFPDRIPVWETIVSALFLLIITLGAVSLRKRYPEMFVGWFWYLITLIPVIGIVKIGLQSMADRYAYVPTVGIFMIVVWRISDIAGKRPLRKFITTCIVSVCIMIFSVLAWHQASYWKDTMTLFSHTLEISKDNYIALCSIGQTLKEQGRQEEALQKFDKALQIAPWYEPILTQQGITLMKQGMLDAAILKFSEAIAQNPNTVPGHTNRGIALAMQGRLDEAISNFLISIEIDKRSSSAHYNLALTMYRQGKTDAAINHYEKALATDPTDFECHNNLGIALASQNKYDQAIKHFRDACSLKPDFIDARNNLMLALKKQGKENPVTLDINLDCR